MPAKLDRCVEKVKEQQKEKGKSPDESEDSAWAICQDSINSAIDKVLFAHEPPDHAVISVQEVNDQFPKFMQALASLADEQFPPEVDRKFKSLRETYASYLPIWRQSLDAPHKGLFLCVEDLDSWGSGSELMPYLARVVMLYGGTIQSAIEAGTLDRVAAKHVISKIRDDKKGFDLEGAVFKSIMSTYQGPKQITATHKKQASGLARAIIKRFPSLAIAIATGLVALSPGFAQADKDSMFAELDSLNSDVPALVEKAPSHKQEMFNELDQEMESHGSGASDNLERELDQELDTSGGPQPDGEGGDDSSVDSELPDEAKKQLSQLKSQMSDFDNAKASHNAYLNYIRNIKKQTDTKQQNDLLKKYKAKDTIALYVNMNSLDSDKENDIRLFTQYKKILNNYNVGR